MEAREPDARNIAALRRSLLAWYDSHARDLPWRRSRDPYAIWVSEIMLQQTRVAAVVERYGAFLRRFPTVKVLAEVGEEEVLALWSGLGYYRRARMLHKAAQVIAREHEGKLPERAAELRALPGIGAYTAAAIASIAHGEPVAVVDGNVERALCRLEGWEGGSKTGPLRRKIESLAGRLVDPARPGDFNQAMMELGAVVCTPRSPRCAECPVERHCQTRGEHKTAPRRPMVSRESAHALVVRSAKKNLEALLEQRPASLTVMPGLWELPELLAEAVPVVEPLMTLRHAIMQVNYRARIFAVAEKDVKKLTASAGRRRWVPLNDASEMALTGLTRKVLARVVVDGEILKRLTGAGREKP